MYSFISFFDFGLDLACGSGRQQMKLPLYEGRSQQAQRELDRVRMAERHMEELKATLREAGFCRSKIQRPLKRRIPPNIELDV